LDAFSLSRLSLTEFLDSFFDNWYLKVTMEYVICDVAVLIIILRIFDRSLCRISTLEFASVLQNWIPYGQISFNIILYSSILFSNLSCEFLPNSQTFYISLSPEYLRLLNTCFYMF